MGIPTDPQYRGRNIQLMGIGFPFMIISLSRDGTKYQSLGDFEALMEESKDELRDLSNEEIFKARDEMDTNLPYFIEEHSQPPSSTNKVTPSDEHHSTPLES
ncbi:hypothetical protein Tco_0874664 [Tanacetum coccineum]|uniref:Uncharacterized protein n=1 Tax=Tanacetum coccineum TaxID=301880 RepID=A0ABQ5BQ95_9ASTR